MMQRKLLISFLLLFFTSSLQADSFELGGSLYYFNYEEFGLTGKSLDKELGILPGIKASYTFQYDDLSVTPFINLYDGMVDYIGHTQSGQPHNTNTLQNLVVIGLDIKAPLKTTAASNLKIGYRNWQWDRDILSKDGVMGLHELYFWHELNIGLEHRFKVKDDSFYTAQLSLLKTLNPEMKIYLENSSETLQLGEDFGLRVQFEKTWLVKANQISLNLIIEYWQFGRSNSVFTNDFFGSSVFITEPQSESMHTSINLNYRF